VAYILGLLDKLLELLDLGPAVERTLGVLLVAGNQGILCLGDLLGQNLDVFAADSKSEVKEQQQYMVVSLLCA